jgi:hypothetical protein
MAPWPELFVPERPRRLLSIAVHKQYRCGAYCALVGGSPQPAAAQQLPPHLGQHVLDLVEQLVRLAEHAIGFGAASRLPVPLFLIFDARDHAGDFGN